MIRIVLDPERCIGQSMCEAIVPEIFEVRDDGKAYVTQMTVGDEWLRELQQAVSECPTRAISLVFE